MKKYISYLASCRMRFAFAALMMLFCGNILFAQSKNTTEDNLSAAYNTPFSYSLENETPWTIKNAKGKLIANGTGSIENQIFAEPGNYTLNIAATPHSNSCEHDHSPKNLTIAVSPMKMVFDLSSVKFSENINGGQSAKGITVTVNADYSSFDNKTSKYNGSFKTFGVGSTITGKLKNGEATLKQGTNTLEFVMDGQAASGNYIAIDFVDINGQVQSYGLTKKIQ